MKSDLVMLHLSLNIQCLACPNLAYNSFISCRYEATSSRRNRSLAKELTTGAMASFFLVEFISTDLLLQNLDKPLTVDLGLWCRVSGPCSCYLLLVFMFRVVMWNQWSFALNVELLIVDKQVSVERGYA